MPMSTERSKMRPGPVPGSVRGETRGEIMRRAEQIFANVGYAGASLDMIADEVGIRRPSVLHHFGSKREIFNRVEQAIFEELGDRVEQATAACAAPFDRLMALLYCWLDFMTARPSAARIIMRNTSDPAARAGDPVEFAERVVVQFEAVLLEGQRTGAFRAIDPAMVLNLLGGGIMHYVCNPDQLGAARHYDRTDERRLIGFRDLLRRSAAAMVLAGD